MIQFFRKNDLSNFIFLLPYIGLLRFYSLKYPIAYQPDEHSGLISEWIFTYLASFPLTQSILAIILIYVQAILINIETNNNRLFLMQNGIPGMLYAFFSSFFIAQQGLSPALISMTFVLLASFDAFRVYKKNTATTNIFNTGLLLGIATLIYPPCILLIIALFIEIGVLRSFSIKERLQYLSGLIAVYWIIGAICYFFRADIFHNFSAFTIFGSVNILVPKGLKESWPLIAIYLTLMIVLASHYNFMKKKGIESRKKIDYFFWFLLFSLLPIFLFEDIDESHVFYLAVPFAVLFSMSLANQKNNARSELIHVIMLLAIFLSLYGEKLNIFSNS